MKQYLLIILALLLSVPAATARDFTYTYQGQTLTYTVLDEDARTCETRKGGPMNAVNTVSGTLIIPEKASDGENEYSVTDIGNFGFHHCVELTTVIIPNSVKCVGVSAFACCDNLTSITIPNSVTSIGYRAFHYCI